MCARAWVCTGITYIYICICVCDSTTNTYTHISVYLCTCLYLSFHLPTNSRKKTGTSNPIKKIHTKKQQRTNAQTHRRARASTFSSEDETQQRVTSRDKMPFLYNKKLRRKGSTQKSLWRKGWVDDVDLEEYDDDIK